MKTFVVLSDSHSRSGAVDRVKRLFAENDYIVHLGDGSGDMRCVFSEYPEKTYICKGNCDFSYGESEFVINAEGMSVLCCHGHRYGVKSGLGKLVRRAKELGCEVALYGHTHRVAIDEVDGVLCVNPGSLGDYVNPGYCFLVLHNKKATATFVPLNG